MVEKEDISTATITRALALILLGDRLTDVLLRRCGLFNHEVLEYDETQAMPGKSQHNHRLGQATNSPPESFKMERRALEMACSPSV